MNTDEQRDVTPGSFLRSQIPSLRRYARSRTSEDPTDMVYEAILKVWTNEQGRRAIEEQSVRVWPMLITTLERTIIDRDRRQKTAKRSKVRTKSLGDLDPLADDTSPTRNLRRSEKAAALNKMIDQLDSPKERAVIRLIDLGDYSRTEAAAQLGISVDKLKRILAIARAKLRKKLKPYREDLT